MYATKEELDTLNIRKFITLMEASKLTGIGVNKLRRYCVDHEDEIVIWIGTKRMVKRDRLENLLDREYSL